METRAPSIAGGFVKDDPPAPLDASAFDPKQHAFGLYVDGRRVPLGAEATVHFEDQNVCIVFVTTVDALRGVKAEAVMQRACGGWKTGEVAIFRETGKLPSGGMVQIKHFVMPEAADGPIEVAVTVMSQMLYSYATNTQLGVRGDDVLVPITALKHPQE